MDLIDTSLLQNMLFFVAGALIGWLTNYFFFQKSEKNAWFTNYPLKERTDQILSMLIENRLEARWSCALNEIVQAPEIPANTDIPHILYFRLTNLHPKPGETVGILCRIADLGLNFGTLEVIDTGSQDIIPTSREGHGYYTCQIMIPINSKLRNKKIEFRLTDNTRKHSVYTIELSIEN